MKTLALITGGIIATHVVANIGINTLRASGGTLGGVAFLRPAVPGALPAQLHV